MDSAFTSASPVDITGLEFLLVFHFLHVKQFRRQCLCVFVWDACSGIVRKDQFDTFTSKQGT